MPEYRDLCFELLMRYPTGDARIGDAVMRTLASVAPMLLPQRIGFSKSRAVVLDPTDREALKGVWCSSSIIGTRRRPEVEMISTPRGGNPAHSTLSFALRRKEVEPAPVKAAFDALCRLLRPDLAWMHLWTEAELPLAARESISFSPDARGRDLHFAFSPSVIGWGLPPLLWRTWFGAPYVDIVGIAALARAGALDVSAGDSRAWVLELAESVDEIVEEGSLVEARERASLAIGRGPFRGGDRVVPKFSWRDDAPPEGLLAGEYADRGSGRRGTDTDAAQSVPTRELGGGDAGSTEVIVLARMEALAAAGVRLRPGANAVAVVERSELPCEELVEHSRVAIELGRTPNPVAFNLLLLDAEEFASAEDYGVAATQILAMAGDGRAWRVVKSKSPKAAGSVEFGISCDRRRYHVSVRPELDWMDLEFLAQMAAAVAKECSPRELVCAEISGLELLLGLFTPDERAKVEGLTGFDFRSIGRAKSGLGGPSRPSRNPAL